ncbi:hypothetical protein Agabi119p4_2516 [Agaricus bisporus var. burnettii]|uniref:Uncharacterized protein n=1 Tax=Agaricus bisporus var. burnettii TaxID=192524 RepID=A0A8H7F984_AGABI|nr:hypothetical protein Agabi119p4_2516 [Agaricus bisporus var. burnettii]
MGDNNPPSSLPSGAKVGPPKRRRASAPTATAVTLHVNSIPTAGAAIETNNSGKTTREAADATPRAPVVRARTPPSLPTVEALEVPSSSQGIMPSASEVDQLVSEDVPSQPQRSIESISDTMPISSRLRKRKKAASNKKRPPKTSAERAKKTAVVYDEDPEPSAASEYGGSEVEDEEDRPAKKAKTATQSKTDKGKKKTKGKGKAVEEEQPRSPPPKERFFMAGVSVPSLPAPVATSFRMPPSRPPPIPATTSLRRLATGEVVTVNNPRSQAELRHNIGTLGPLLIRDEIRGLFTLPDTHSLHNAVRCTNCIIRAIDDCQPDPSLIGACGECSLSKTSHCSFVSHPEVELTELGGLNALSSSSTYNLMRTTQSLMADQAAIHLTLGLLQNQITHAALNIEAYAHEWQRAGIVHGVRRLSEYGLARSPEEVQDFLDFLTAQQLGTKDSTLSRRLADQQNTLSRVFELIRRRDGEVPTTCDNALAPIGTENDSRTVDEELAASPSSEVEAVEEELVRATVTEMSQVTPELKNKRECNKSLLGVNLRELDRVFYKFLPTLYT